VSSKNVHVVWDWNGTIFDDADLIIAITEDNFRQAGLRPVSRETFRAAYRRPIRDFYQDVAGVPLSDEKWQELNERFHQDYAERAPEVRLADGVRDVFAHVHGRGWTQSLLSMYPEDGLLEFVRIHQLTGVFTRVDGSQGVNAGHSKAEYLVAHVEAIGADPGQVVVVGDSTDDVAAARHVGARAILYDGGLHLSDTLHSAHDVVAHNMAEVIQLLSDDRIWNQ
jgi:phosphoglycolate phosphatase-like HAD superfamily hydrolase